MDSATNFMSETLNNVLSMDKIEEGEEERKEGLKEGTIKNISAIASHHTMP